MQLLAIVSNSGLVQLHTMIEFSIVIRETTISWEIHRSGCFPKLVVLKHRYIYIQCIFLIKTLFVSGLKTEKHYSNPKSETITVMITWR